jgi:hypothetical protein
MARVRERSLSESGGAGTSRLSSSSTVRRCLFVLLLSGSAAQAADLGRFGPPGVPAPYPTGHYPRGFAAVAPRCVLVPQPQFNLYNDVTWYRPIWVCASRGLQADTLWPYPWPY